MLSPYRILDLSDERGLFCSRLLGELGAEVIHVEPPGGSPARHRGRYAGGAFDPERSLTWWAMARDSKSVVVDLDSPGGRDSFHDLVRSADMLIESADPGSWEHDSWAQSGLGYDDLSAINPRLVWVSITAFGSDGPKAGYEATDLIVQAASGAMTVTGEADRAPLRAAGVPAWTHAGAEAAGGALIALHEAQRSGRGQRVEISAQRATNLTCQFSLPAAQVGHRPITRAGGFNLYGIDVPFIWPTSDGFVSLTLAIDPVNKPFLDRLLQFMVDEGHGRHEVTDRDWVAHLRLIRAGDRPNTDLIPLRDAVAAFLASKTKGDLFAAALDRKLLLVPVASFDDLYESPQLRHRSFWIDEALPDGSTVKIADHLVRSTRPRNTPRQPAPTIGQHTNEILATVARPHANDQTNQQSDDQARPAPLAGVKVLDMMWVMAGPYSTGILAQYGATVVRVENEARLDTARLLAPWYDGKVGKEQSMGFASINANKLSVTIDPNNSEGRDLILELVQWADIVTESFSPRAMKKWGLDYETLRKDKPDLIMASSCLMGQDGPYASVAGYGTMGSAAAGLVQPTGWPDRKPNGPYGAYTDYCAPRITVAALLSALDHRNRTGEGQYIDQSQVESTLNYVMPAILDHQLNGTEWDRMANNDHEMSPHGAYRSAGDDEWVAIAVRDDADWSLLARELGHDGWIGWGLAERKQHRDAIDEALTGWTSLRSPTESETTLQALGVPAHAVLHTNMPFDPQLKHLDHQVMVHHVDRGQVPVERTRIQLSQTPPVVNQFPKIGQHTEQVLTSILDYDGEGIDRLRQAGALGSARKERKDPNG